MSPFISTSPACLLLILLVLLSPAMPSLSSPLAPKGQPMRHSITAVLPFVLLSIVILLASSCEARGLHVHGKVRSSSKSHLPGKDVAAITSSKADGWLTRKMEATSTAVHTTPTDGDHMPQADAKMEEGVKMAAASAGAVRATATPVAVRVSQRLSRREDTGFHLDYAGPRTHTPSHN